MARIVFITGITGQDGGYLAEFLLKKGYAVHGLVRWDCSDGTERLRELGLLEKVALHFGDINDAGNIISLVNSIQPDEIYNLAALSHVKVSFETPASTLQANAAGTLNILEAVRILEIPARIYQASSSEMFGNAPAPQNEDTPFQPCSPYGVGKLAAYWMARTYRDSYGVHVSNGILFNHESPLRGEDFVTRKIAAVVAAIEAGEQTILRLGNLDSVRDWGHARDYVEGMWMMLQQEKPGDYVLATGEAHTVREFAERAFVQIGVKIEWRGSGAQETGRDVKTGRMLVAVDEAFFRPTDLRYLLGDAAKARRVLGWRPRLTFDALVAEMVNAERGKIWRENGAWRMAG
ncbi:MAG: GDP-mannose 4,6-dehydratase [Alphaproteobacteria bacterium]|nr:GDP-mannose 4,6-dehydratase [Alphaproteobacteria bacterium]